MRRRLLNIASIVCLLMTVALLGMWMRSYYRKDCVGGSISDTRVFAIETIPGRLYLSATKLNRPDENDPYRVLRHWRHRTEPIDSSEFQKPDAPQGYFAAVGFDWYLGRTAFLILPTWFLVLVCGCLAMGFQIRRPVQFRIRHLFIATTFLAVVLGMSAWLDRAWIGK
jgi:hypothetical protein